MVLDAPDFSTVVRPIKPVPDITQAMFWWAESPDVPAGSTNAGTIYTVPAGKKLILLAYDVSQNISSLNLFLLTAGGYNFAHTWFDVDHHCPFGGEGAVSYGAGTVIQRVFYNYNSVQINFRLTLFGFLVDA